VCASGTAKPSLRKLVLATKVRTSAARLAAAASMVQAERGVARVIEQHAYPASPEAVLDRIPATCDFVLIGEASHGTADFYDFRASLTRLLIQQRAFNAVALEAGAFFCLGATTRPAGHARALCESDKLYSRSAAAANHICKRIVAYSCSPPRTCALPSIT